MNRKRTRCKHYRAMQRKKQSEKRQHSSQNPVRKIIPFIIAAVWLGILIFLSSQNGENTAATSLPIAEWLQQHVFTTLDVGTVHMMIRKDAHFIVFFVEAFLFLTAVYNVWGKLWRSVGGSTILCVSLAYVDEAHKALIPGRHCQWNEAGMNATGALLGIAVFLLIYFIIWGIRKIGSC